MDTIKLSSFQERVAASLPRWLAALANSCGDPGRFALEGVMLRIDGATATCEASDGKQAVRVTLAGNGTVTDDGADARKEAIIPAATWKKAFASLPKKGGDLQATLGEADTILDAGQTTLRASNLKGRWPPIGDVLPTGKPRLVIQFHPAVMMKALRTFADAMNFDENIAVEFCIYDQTSPVLLKATVEGAMLEGVVMTIVKERDADVAKHVGRDKTKNRLLGVLRDNAAAIYQALRQVANGGSVANAKKAEGRIARLLKEARRG